jgi:transposase InsO family protein
VIFPCFGTPKMVISDGGSHFIDKTFWNFLKEHGSSQNIATPYHPQTSGQTETSNKQIKTSYRKWSMRWRKAGRTSCLMHFGHTWQLTKPYRHVTIPAHLWKSFHLPFELEHRAHWAIKSWNMDVTTSQQK